MMIYMASQVFIFLSLFVPSLFEGLGLWVDHRVFLFYFSVLSTFLYVSLSFSLKPPEHIKIPMRAGLLWIFFLIFSIISTFFFSVDKQVSFEMLLLYYSCFLLFIFFYNYKKITHWYIYYLPVILGVFFTCYSFILPFLKQKGFNFLLPVFEKQFVFASYTGHNHLGDFIGLLLIIFTYLSFKKKLVFLSFFTFFLVILITSFSRSAYWAFFVVFVLMLFHYRKKLSSHLLPLFFFFLALIMFVTYLFSVEQPLNSPFLKVQIYGKRIFNVAPRNIISSRDIYAKQALYSIKEHPFFGVGGGNFLVVSKRNIIMNNFSDSAHNIFLELTTEQGILAAFFFFILVLYISRQALVSPSLPGYLFLYLLLNFQTDYTYQIYSLFVFWIILSALVSAEKKELSISYSLCSFFSIIPLIILVCITTSTLLVQIGKYKSAIQLYPFNNEAYRRAIKSQDDQTEFYIKQGEIMAPYDIGIIANSAEYFLQQGDRHRALLYYEKIYAMNRLCSFYFIKQIYILKRSLYSQKQATYFLRRIVNEYKRIFATNSLREEVADFCREVDMQDCPKVGWNN